jgi:hypothetical protein
MGNKQPRRQRATAQGYGGPVRLQLLPDIRGLTGVWVSGTHVTLELAYKVLKRAFKELLEDLVNKQPAPFQPLAPGIGMQGRHGDRETAKWKTPRFSLPSKASIFLPV